MLNEGHGGIFSAAVQRITEQNPAVGAMLRALAFGRGRGLPESGGTWVAIARAIGGDVAIPDAAIQTTIEIAAPYITLDGEAGQSTYRLAHQTFVEHFTTRQLDDFVGSPKQRAIAAALLELVERSGGWATANYYWVRYLPLHLESGLDLEGLAALTTNPGWLRRAIDLLGVDRTVNAISGGNLSLSLVANVVQKALRRCRIALSQNRGQLAGQMHARLRNNSDPRLARLGSALAAESPYTTLQMRYGHLNWMADLETTYPLVGKVRALAFGRVDDKTLLAIGVEKQIHLWDPRQGPSDTLVFDNEDRRVNALAFGELGGRPVLVVASSYDGQVGMIRNASTGEQIGESFPLPGYVDSLAMGLLDGRLAVVGSGNGQLLAWDIHARSQITPPEFFQEVRVCAVFELEGRVVACVVRNRDAWVVDVATGAALWPNPMPLEGELTAVTAGNTAQDGFMLAGYIDRSTIVTWSPKEARELRRLDAKAEFDVPVRALAFAEVDALGREKVVALGPDYDNTSLVRLCQLDLAFGHDRQPFVSSAKWLGPGISAVFASDDGALLALTESPLAIYDLTSDGRGPPLGLKPDQATVAFAITGRSTSKAAFAARDRSVLWRPPGDPKGPTRRSIRAGGAFQLDEPGEWPRSTWAWGQVGDRAAVATGSVAGAVWIWDVVTGRPMAGPLVTVSPRVLELGWRGMGYKGSPACVESIAFGRHPDRGDIVAVAFDGRVRIFSLTDGEELPTPTARATVITCVALGRILDEDVLVTGSKGGAVILWNLGSRTRLAALTLDKGIDQVWVVHGADAIAVRASSEIYVLDVVPGTETFTG
jgi:WD40 repeat protein